MSEAARQDRVFSTVSSGFGDRTVVVVGDLMLDRFLWGTADRISPEAPVPVVRLARTSEAGGGAANVALNVASLGLRVHVAGVVGDDVEGRLLLDHLAANGVSTACVQVVPGRPTTVKTRVMAAQRQLLRIDREISDSPPTLATDALLAAVRVYMADAAVVVLSDYAKGVLDAQSCTALISEANALGIPVLVDSKSSCFDKFLGATAITPNLPELSTVIGISPERHDSLMSEAHGLRERLRIKYLVVTRGEMGITLISSAGTKHFSAEARDVSDVSGAGDTVIAVLAACLAADLDIVDSIYLANLGAGAVVAKPGTHALSLRELMKAVRRSGVRAISRIVHSRASVVDQVRYWRSMGESVVFTNGCFDLLHVGHVTYLESAKRLGDRLVVGINTDRSVRALKGPKRPVVSERERVAVIAALASVDAVVPFDEDTPFDLILAVQPDVLTKGADYSDDQVVGAREVRSWGGTVSLVPLVCGWSTSKLLAGILQRSTDGQPAQPQVAAWLAGANPESEDPQWTD